MPGTAEMKGHCMQKEERARCKGITEHGGLGEQKELDMAGVWAELWWGRRRQERGLIK